MSGSLRLSLLPLWHLPCHLYQPFLWLLLVTFSPAGIQGPAHLSSTPTRLSRFFSYSIQLEFISLTPHFAFSLPWSDEHFCLLPAMIMDSPFSCPTVFTSHPTKTKDSARAESIPSVIFFRGDVLYTLKTLSQRSVMLYKLVFNGGKSVQIMYCSIL